MITVFHFRSDLPRETMWTITSPAEEVDAEVIRDTWTNLGYAPVADIDTDSLDMAWRLSNNIDESWIENPEVTNTYSGPIVVKGRRSSCVGDVFLRDGKYYVVASFGFEEIDLPPCPIN